MGMLVRAWGGVNMEKIACARFVRGGVSFREVEVALRSV